LKQNKIMNEENDATEDQQADAKIDDLEPKKDAKGGGKSAAEPYQTGGSAGGGMKPGAKGWSWGETNDS